MGLSNTIMIKKVAIFLIISMLFSVSFVAYAAEDDTRYFVKSNNSFWKKSFGVRHNFDEGFTTDATEWQLKLARIFGVEIEPIKKLYILPAQEVDQVLADKSDSSAKINRVVARPKPSDQTPWGVETVYNNLLLEKSSGGTGVNVAILDTGVYKSHLDLKNRIKDCKDFTGLKPITDGKCDDKNGHGTHVAGIIAADGGVDGLGIYGVAP